MIFRTGKSKSAEHDWIGWKLWFVSHHYSEGQYAVASVYIVPDYFYFGIHFCCTTRSFLLIHLTILMIFKLTVTSAISIDNGVIGTILLS